MAEESSVLQSVGNLIPSIYYDLIARVGAGAPFIALLLWAQISASKDLASNLGLECLLLLGSGYIAGILLTTFTLFWSALIGFAIRIVFRTHAADWRHASRNDEIAAADKEAGVTIAKMQAEATLCQNLLSAFVVLIVANDTGAFSVSALSNHGTAFRWVVFSALLSAAFFRVVVYLDRQNSFYKIHVLSALSMGAS